LKSVCVDDLVVALPIFDFSRGQRVKDHQIKRAFVRGHHCGRRVRIAFVAPRISEWQEVLVKGNVQFGSQNLFRIKLVVVSKSLENLSCFGRGFSH